MAISEQVLLLLSLRALRHNDAVCLEWVQRQAKDRANILENGRDEIEFYMAQPYINDVYFTYAHYLTCAYGLLMEWKKYI